MLAVASSSRRFVTKDWSSILKPQWQWMLLVVIEVEAADGCCKFRTQAQITMMQSEGVEVLPQLLPEACLEEVATLNDRSIDKNIASLCKEGIQRMRNPLLLLVGFGQDIPHAT